MQRYRIFIFDKKNRFARIELADYPADDDALARAAEFVSDQHGSEVWQFARIVGRPEPHSSQTSAIDYGARSDRELETASAESQSAKHTFGQMTED